MTRNIKLIIEYEGTNYSGWQIQPGSNTIQDEIQNAIKTVTNEDVTLCAAGRTDAGVHAIGQVANFKTNTSIPVSSIPKALNSVLPYDIVIISADEVDLDFNARRSSKGKVYKYLIYNQPFPSAIYRRFSWHFRHKLDIETMQKGASLLEGRMDFSSFRASGCTAKHAVRRVFNIDITKDEGGVVAIKVHGQAFLRHMVRIIAGTLVDLGRDKITLNDIKDIIEARDRTKAGMTAPAKGLFLKEVCY